MRPADPSEAYAKLDAILAREEYQDYVSPIEWIVEVFDGFASWFATVPLWGQIAFISALVLLLLAIVAHLVWTLVRVWRAGLSGDRLPEPASVLSVRDLPPSRTLLARGREALAAGQRAEALRLFYLALVALLGEKGRIVPSTALTGREILAGTRPPLEGMGRATDLFERTVYGGVKPDDEDVGTVRRLAEGGV